MFKKIEDDLKSSIKFNDHLKIKIKEFEQQIKLSNLKIRDFGKELPFHMLKTLEVSSSNINKNTISNQSLPSIVPERIKLNSTSNNYL